MKPYKDPRLNKLMGKPERVVETDGTQSRHPSRVGAIEQGSSGLAFRTFVAYARSLGYDIEIKLIPTDPSLTPLTAVLPSEPLATEPTP